MTRRNGVIRLGLVNGISSPLPQIESLLDSWCAEFGKQKASIEPVAEIGSEAFDLYLVMVDRSSEKSLPGLLQRAAATPCLLLASNDGSSDEEEALFDAALAAGAADYMALATLDASRFEQAVRFCLQRQRKLEAGAARERVVAAAWERERQQLANALHDGPMQELIGARFLLGAISTGEAAGEVQNSLQAVVQSIRGLCSDLKPPALAPFGLEKAVRAHLQAFQKRYPEIGVTVEMESDSLSLPEWARLAFFRVYQEAVSNVARHARAAHLQVQLEVDAEQLRLRVADDGQGFELPGALLDYAGSERYGLLIMQERMDVLQGRMMVQSILGSGTRVVAQAPLKQPLSPLPASWESALAERNV